MNLTMLDEVVNRSNRRILLLSLGALVAVVIGLALAGRYYYNFFLGPFPIAHDDLLDIENPDGRWQYYVDVKGEDSYDTGFQYGDDDSVERSYVAVEIDDRWLLVVVPGAVDLEGKLARDYVGGLITIPDDVQNEVIEELYAEYDDLDGIFLPYMLDARDFRNPGYAGLAASVVVALGGLYGLYMAASRMSNPAKHPIYKALAVYGEPRRVAQHIELQLAAEHPHIGDLHWTRTWLVKKRGVTLEVVKHTDIIWLYQLTTQHRTNGIPTGKTYSAMIRNRQGKTITQQAKEPMVIEILNQTIQYAPWAVRGHSKEIEQMWNKQRNELAFAVDQRREQMQNSKTN